MSEWVSLREYARRKGVSDTAIRKSIKAGKISLALRTNPKNGRPEINPAIADDEWSRNHNPMQERTTRSGVPNASIHGGQANEAPASASGAYSQVGEQTLAAAKRATAVYKAKMSELEYKQKAGQLIDAEKVRRSLYEFGAQVRERVLKVPDLVVDRVLATKTRNEAHIMLMTELNSALESLTSENLGSEKIG